MARTPTTIRIARATYALFLYLLPRRLRRAQGRRMRRLFSELAAEAHRSRGARGVAHLLFASGWDVVLTAATSRRRARNGKDSAHGLGITERREGNGMDTIWFETKATLKSLSKRPGLVALSALTLALGIGANTAIFSVLWGAWLKPLPFPTADRLVWISDSYRTQTGGGSSMSLANVVDLESESRLLEDIVVFGWGGAALGEEEDAERILGMGVDPGFFHALGMPPALGRAFVAEDAKPGSEPVVILTWELWQEALGGAPDVVGSSVVLGGSPHTVVGVTPPAFRFRWDPRAFWPNRWTEAQLLDRGARNQQAFGLLAEGASLEAAAAELNTIFDDLRRTYPEVNEGWSVWVAPLRDLIVGTDHTLLAVMGGAALLVLLIACVNVAGLLLARAEVRRREIAVRRAMGADRARLLTTWMGEGLVLALLGGATGILVAHGGIGILLSIFGNQLRRRSEIGLDPTVLGVAVGITLLTGVLVSLLPALRDRERDVGASLREGGRSASGTGTRLRRGLVVAEVALAVTLVTGAGLLVHTMWKLGDVDMGYRHTGAYIVGISTPSGGSTDDAERAAFFREATERIRRSPEVAAVGLINIPPPSRVWSVTRVTPSGRESPVAENVLSRYVSEGYFGAAGISLLEGRGFQPDEAVPEDAPTPAVVSEPLARALFPDGGAVGRQIELSNGRELRVVGVVEGVREGGPERETWETFYLPFPGAGTFGTMSAVVRSDAGPERVAAVARSAVDGVAAGARVTRPTSMSEGVSETLGDQRFALSLLGVFAGVALLLGAIGIHGVMSFTVTRRTREVGIRKALGATRGRVMRDVVGEGLRLVAGGLVVGIVLALALSRFLAAVLYEVGPTDPVTLAGVVAVLLLTALASCWIPARRAAATPSMEAIRAE